MKRFLIVVFACAVASAAFAQSADLVLDSVGPAGPFGSTLHATIPITFTNHGPSAATDVKVTFTIPGGATFAAVTVPAPLSCTSPAVGLMGEVVCTAPSLDPTGNPVTVNVTVQIAPAPGTTLIFTGVLTSSNAQTSPQSASTTIGQPLLADVSITGATSPSIAYIGSTYDNVVTITNRGPGVALKPRLTASFSADCNTASPPIAPPGWTCETSATAEQCTIDSLPPGSATFTFRALAIGRGQGGMTVTLLCQNSVVPGVNQTGTNTIVQLPPETDLEVSISGMLPVVHTGDEQTYTAQVKNKGSSAAIEVRLDAEIPGTLISSSPSSYFVIDPGTTVTASYVVRVDATAAGPLTASATATAANVAGPRMANTTTACAGRSNVDLQATLTPPDAVIGGVPAVWTVDLVNNGPDPDHGWRFSVQIAPAFIQAITTTDPRARCTLNGCEGFTNDRVTIRITAVPPTFRTETIHASATVTVNPDVDVHPENNTVTADSPVTPAAADLSVAVKAATSTIALAGTGDVTIDIANIGGLPNFDLTVVVPLAPAFTLVGPAPFCSGTTTLVCVLAGISPGQSYQLPLTVRATGSGTFILTATATTTDRELRTDNNTALLSITVLDPGARHRGAHH